MTSNNEKDFSLGNSINKNKFFNRVFNYFSREDVIVKSIFIVGIFSIFFGILGMYINIKNSLITPEVAIENTAVIVEGLNRIKDTDLDGLPDYEELNTYNTSPYLEDTDLDGVSDYDEMILGRDGECSGDNCKIITAPEEELDVMSLLGGLDFQDVDFQTFKQTLIESGYDEATFDSLTEEDFNQMKQMLPSEESGDVNFSNQTELTKEELQQIEQMRNISIQDIKSLMIQGGATEEKLSEFSDDDLKQIYLQTLDELSSSQY
ncbi:MAG: hypothetical protein PHH83_00025 [Patescibacteria group bacterium]|nr:hypothetical protein [Patescibacteria group bacterium]